jgi:hypothetical protein
MSQTSGLGGEKPGDKPGAGEVPIKSRVELKRLFRNGGLPDENAFGDLIEAFVHRNDLWEKPGAAGGETNAAAASVASTHRISALNRSWYVYVDSHNNLVVAESDALRLRINANDRVEIGGPDVPFALQVNGWAGLGMRMGIYNPADDARKEYPSSALVTLQAAADGRWHPIVEGLGSCHAFEVVASASGAAASKNHSITHAIAVSGISGGRKSIQHTYSYDGWYWRRKIRLKWQPSAGRFAKGTDYSLCVRTGCNFGKGDDGKPVMIRYHMTRLW